MIVAAISSNNKVNNMHALDTLFAVEKTFGSSINVN